MRFRFSHRAESDIEEIADFIARYNPQRAVTYIDELRVRCRKLAEFPESTPARPPLGDDVRVAVFGRYLILYKMHNNFMEIRRVVHGARDLSGEDILN
jgi:toxin ParE1/3/4